MLGGTHRFPHPSLQHFLFRLQSVSDLHWDPQVKLTKGGMIGHFPDFTLKRIFLQWYFYNRELNILRHEDDFKRTKFCKYIEERALNKSVILVGNRVLAERSLIIRAVFTWLSKGIGFGFGFGFTTTFGWLVYLLWFWFYDSQVKTALCHRERV